MAEMVFILFIWLTSYIIGSIPTGFILVKSLTGEDIRDFGSGNIGATNVKRRLGTWSFFVVMSIDMLKGFVPVFYVNHFYPHTSSMLETSTIAVITGFCLILGNSKSIFLKLTGGKSAATGAGVLFGLCWQVALIVLIGWSLIVAITKYISLASITVAFATPILMYLFHQPPIYILFCTLAALYVGIYLHISNIKRLISGKESKINS